MPEHENFSYPKILPQMLADYEVYLRDEERSTNTITKYVRDLKAFFSFINGQEFTKALVLEWKNTLTAAYAPASVNSMLAAVNGFLVWAGFPQYKVKPLKIQKEIFTKPEKELTREEYLRLIKAANAQNNRRLALLIETICATGIRVSELRFITVDAIKTARAVVDCKGKTRIVFLPNNLCRALRSYCYEQKIKSGVIFCTKNGMPLDRSNIWRDMKALCQRAHVQPEKVFPHNLRHLFARTYYTLEKDISRLADLLGHSSIATTRIYTMESGAEHVRQLERLGLVPA
ncbi:MAG: tyrosine-type recombinase/integrase [Oscillospiraceae bacterium]|nr:tyrosine-type recombinase/integrase [Oscillospiraceae bacterium]